MLDKVEIAWAAGLFEGEGCIFATDVRRAHLRYSYVALSIVNADKDVMDRFVRAVGYGKLYSKTVKTVGHKPLWELRVTGQPAEAILSVLLPHLGKRRNQQYRRAVAKSNRIMKGRPARTRGIPMEARRSAN